MIEQYYNRHDPAKNFESVMFRADRILQSAELNEIQSMAAYRLQSIADALFKDGNIVRDARIVVNADSGDTTCESGAVYLKGMVRGVPTRAFTIATNTIVTVGIYLKESDITELEDPSLRNPAIDTRGAGEPGAARKKLDPVWGYAGDGQTGEFYPVYVVENGIVRSKEPPPNLDAVTQSLARYDRDSSGGGYVVSGLTLAKAADVGGDQVYTLTEGRARVGGFGVELATGRRLVYSAVPDLRFVDSEPHISTTAGAMRVNLNRTPVADISAVRVTTRKVATVTHGGFTNAQDPLPNTSVVSIVAVNQSGVVNGAGDGFTGGTTFVQGADYKLTADKVDWSLGGAEVSILSTYQVIYDCIELVAPSAVDETGFTVTGAVVGTQVLTSYNQKLPRIDRLCLDAEGGLQWIKGIAAEFNPQAPAVPTAMLGLASVYQTWTAARRVINDSIRAVPMQDLANMTARMDYLASLIAQQNLKTDAANRDTALKKGMFVDPFIDDSMRDQGVAQTAAIVLGQLTLPVAATVGQVSTDITKPTTLGYTLAPVLSQTARTGSMKVNPYQAFDPIPAKVTLTPAVDRWTDVSTTWSSPVTERITIGSGNASSVSTSTRNQLLSSSSRPAENLRQIEVSFSLSGFGPNEQLASVKFDGIEVTPVVL